MVNLQGQYNLVHIGWLQNGLARKVVGCQLDSRSLIPSKPTFSPPPHSHKWTGAVAPLDYPTNRVGLFCVGQSGQSMKLTVWLSSCQRI